MFKWFRGKDRDVKTLEKELAGLASKINKHEANLSRLRANARRYKGAMTLYSVLFYAIYLAIWFMLFARDTSDRQKWILETLPILVGPVVIYVVRSTLSAYYTRVITNEDSSLVSLKTQQNQKVEEFKTKTDFYTTKSLIDRYSGGNDNSAPETKMNSPKTPTEGSGGSRRTDSSPSLNRQNQVSTQLQNKLPRLPQMQSQLTPQRTNASLSGTVPTPSSLSGTPIRRNEPPKVAEFAPNAEAVALRGDRHWYDRILDIIVGEDEGNDSSRYKLEQKVRAREEQIAGLEVELMKLRKLVETEHQHPESEATKLLTSPQASQHNVQTTATESAPTVRTRNMSKKAKQVHDDKDDDE